MKRERDWETEMKRERLRDWEVWDEERETKTEMTTLKLREQGGLRLRGGTVGTRAARQGEEDWSDLQSPSPIRRSVGSGVLELCILGLWVRYFSLDFRLVLRFLSFFLSSAVRWFLRIWFQYIGIFFFFF